MSRRAHHRGNRTESVRASLRGGSRRYGPTMPAVSPRLLERLYVGPDYRTIHSIRGEALSIFAPVNVASQTSEHQRGDRWGRDINTLYKRKTVYITWT